MDERRDVRASDSDRAAAVERLRAALDEGRLSLLEYDDRLARAYQSVTYGELADLFVDLPATAPASMAKRKSAAPARKSRDGVTGFLASQPTALKVLWTVWLAAVSINLVIWALVSLSNMELTYFWPMWVAGPAGAALLGVSAGIALARRDHQPEPRHLPRGRDRDEAH